MSSLSLKDIDMVTLDGTNWSQWYQKIRGLSRLGDCWDVVKGEDILDASGTVTGQDLTPRPTNDATDTANYITDANERIKAQNAWKKKNGAGLALLQLNTTPAIYNTIKDLPTASAAFKALETKYSKAGGAMTYLQLVNMMKSSMTDSQDITPQIQTFQENYEKITSNGYSKLLEDLAMFMLASALPNLFQPTARQYLDNIDDIQKIKLSDLTARVTEEEARSKARDLNNSSHASTSKISTTKPFNKKCDKCGKTNHTTKQHWPDGKPPSNNKQKAKPKGKGKGKGKTKEKKNGKSRDATVNGLNIIEVPSMSINSNESISVSCYIEGELTDWMMDTGCSQHVTPFKQDFAYYWKFPKP